MTTSLAPELKNAHVLVVDDDPGVRGLLLHLLRAADCHAEGVPTLEDARASLEQRVPDALLLDLDLSGESGLALLRQLRAEPSTSLLPVILLTGHDRPEPRRHAAAAGVNVFLAKPFDTIELQLRLEELIRRKRVIDALEESSRVLVTLARALEARDPLTAGHSERVACLAVRLGRRIGMPSAELGILEQGAWVHDIGKVGVPDRVLRKPGPLDPDEQRELRRHPEVGVHILENLRSMVGVIPIVRSHHERLDGSGYPDGLRGEQVPILARVVAIADVYDALTSERPYRAAFEPDRAVDALEQEARDGKLDPALVRAFRAEAGPQD